MIELEGSVPNLRLEDLLCVEILLEDMEFNKTNKTCQKEAMKNRKPLYLFVWLVRSTEIHCAIMEDFLEAVFTVLKQSCCYVFFVRKHSLSP